ncbi:MAG TPA: indole-3-glycerol-phosphate synthase, partial [Bacteroidetes bacterium]|nr:indole-3-glycerol-phosphate synthase [Bacteroidota bacterium]
MNLLEQIVKNKKKEVAAARRKKTSSQLIIESGSEQPRHSFFSLLNEKNGFHFICEIKKASPSQGMIQANFDPCKQAQDYLEGGASVISILTDEKYFQGHLDHLKQVRKIVSLPVLRKDFIIDPYQIIESKVAGADMILLISRILTKNQIAVFRNMALALKLDVLLEIAEERELEK